MTPERELLLRSVCSMTRHFTHEELMASLRRRGARVSQATVYRALPLLEEAGIIRRASVYTLGGSGAPVFEHVHGREHHDHLVCSACGRVVEFHYPGIEALQELVAREHGFRLQRHHLELVGLCAACQPETAAPHEAAP